MRSTTTRDGAVRNLLLGSRLGSLAVLIAVAAFAAAPTPALAAEAGAESAGTTESAPSGTGWIPQEDPTEAAGGAGTAPTQQGSSLGSGGSSKQGGSSAEAPSPPREEQPTYSEPPASTTTPSSSYEPESPAPEPLEEPASTLPAQSAPPEPPPEKVAPRPTGRSGLDPASAVARPDPPRAGDAGGVAQVAGVSLSSGEEQADSGSSALLWPALIICVLILIYAGTRLVLGPVEPNILRSGRLRNVRRTFPRA